MKPHTACLALLLLGSRGLPVLHLCVLHTGILRNIHPAIRSEMRTQSALLMLASSPSGDDVPYHSGLDSWP
ncbi:hypothetical protein BDW02DRAFT_141510 [Decorospora gaudefroyi]|uniref:Uncharacterized protein n=1 Tax=Decorospora gaudefroyi TaxID=184978 RepID=A0A6A5KNZ6_9PLEO|nr:hypothetical protein BDW02DRAFT_141510 [Decorospora gaudefroyi]